MALIDRITLGGLALGLMLAARSACSSARTTAQAAPLAGGSVQAQPAPAESQVRELPVGLQPELAAFNRELMRFREGDESALALLSSSSDRLCSEFARCDARKVADYYAALSPAQRKIGLEEEARYSALRKRVEEARRQELDVDEWTDVQADIQAELRALIDRVLAEQADFVPAARALSLGALLDSEQVDVDPELDVLERESLLARAADGATRSIELFERAGMSTPRLEPLYVRARLSAARGEISKARSAFDECLTLARKLNRSEYQADALHGMIDLARDIGDEPQLVQLLHELAALQDPAKSWRLTERQADFLLMRDQSAFAIEFLLRNEPSDARALRPWHLLLGSAKLRIGDLAGARAEYLADETMPWTTQTRLAMASLDLCENHPQCVLDQFNQRDALDGFSSLERAQAQGMVGEAWLQLGDAARAVGPLTSALSQAAQWQTRLESERGKESSNPNIIGERFGLHDVSLLALALGQTGSALEAARVIEATQSRTLRNSSGMSERRQSDRKSFELEDIRAWAARYELGILTFVSGANSSVVVWVARDGEARAREIPRARLVIEDAIRRLRESVIAGARDETRALAAEICSEFFPSGLLAEVLANRSTARDRLLFLLHGPFESLPIEVLEVEGRALDESLVPLVLPGLPWARPQASLAAGDLQRWSLLGSPVDTRGVPMLPGSLDELRSLARLHPGSDATIGRTFDRAALFAALASDQALHIATHVRYGCGTDSGRLSDAGLEVSGGASVCAREILAAGPRLPLAVLAACETAEGRFVDAEGLNGIARAFLESGTRNVIVTLWPVEDQSARTFAIEFHRALALDPSPSVAAASARRSLREQGSTAADWAAFRSIGQD